MNTGADLPAMNIPEILSASLSEGLLKLDIYISPDLSCFKGHFTGNPVLPGVIQLQWAVHFAREYFGQEMPVLDVERLKFTGIIQPELTLTLTIEMSNNKAQAQFRYDTSLSAPEQPGIVYSQGRLIYASAGQS